MFPSVHGICCLVAQICSSQNVGWLPKRIAWECLSTWQYVFCPRHLVCNHGRNGMMPSTERRGKRNTIRLQGLSSEQLSQCCNGGSNTFLLLTSDFTGNIRDSGRCIAFCFSHNSSFVHSNSSGHTSAPRRAYDAFEQEASPQEESGPR